MLGENKNLMGSTSMFSNIGMMNGTSGKNEENYREIDVDSLVPFKDHPFKVEDDDNFESLKMSISEIGVKERLIVRKNIEGKYEVISGHRRLEACRELSMSTVPCEIVDVDDDTADIMMVDCNQHRTKLSPSEISNALRIKNEALKNYRKRHGDKEGLYTKNNLSNSFGLSERTIYNYISLSKLIPELMSLVDSGKLKLLNGFFIAGNFDEEDQKSIYQFYEETQKLPDANQLKRVLEARTNDRECDLYHEINKIVNTDTVKKKHVSFNDSQLSEYFAPTDTEEYIEDVVTQLLKGWHEGRYLLEKAS